MRFLPKCFWEFPTGNLVVNSTWQRAAGSRSAPIVGAAWSAVGAGGDRGMGARSCDLLRIQFCSTRTFCSSVSSLHLLNCCGINCYNLMQPPGYVGRRLKRNKKGNLFRIFWHTNPMSVYYLVFLLQRKKLVDTQSRDAFIREQGRAAN